MDSENFNQTQWIALTDVQLWQAITQGYQEALGVLYDRHAGLVYGIAFKTLNHSQEAEDLTQDIFVGLARLSYVPQRGSLRTFLAIVTRSRAIDRLRSQKTRTKRTLQYLRPDPSALSDATLEESITQAQGQVMHSALAQLPENQQQLLRMTYYDGLTQATIAERLDLPLGTVKSRVRRGLLKLRQILHDQLDRSPG